MPIFLLGLVLGALSGTGTFLFTTDTALSLIVAAVVALVTWCGYALVVVLDD